MNTAIKLGVAALSLNALIAGTAVVRSQQFWSAYAERIPTITAGPQNLTVITLSPPGPQGALYHQVVDIYYDSDGNKLETKSMTHTINEYCQSGVRRQEDLVAQDDGHGNVKFASVRLPGEPATGVKPVTAEGRIKAMMAIKASPEQPTVATDTNPQLAAR